MFSFFLNLNNFSDLDYRMFIRQLQQMLEVGVNGIGGWGWLEGGLCYCCLGKYV